MGMVQCERKLHYYLADTYDSCPFCEDQLGAEGEANQNPVPPVKEEPIQPAPQPAPAPNGLVGRKTDVVDNHKTERKTRPLHESAEKPVTTIITGGDQKQSTSSSQLPVAGWLVIVSGSGRGKDFRLIQGENRIGRNADMEICLDLGTDTDTTVSRDAHAVVVYDNQSNEFFVERGTSRNLPMVNGKTVRRDQDLSAYDVIQVGETQLLFFPLCGDTFRW